MGRIISVLSGKGGAGKSTVAAGVARILTASGKRVLLADTDAGLRSAEFLTPNGAAAVYTMADVTAGTISLDRAIVPGDGCPDFLAAPAQEDTWDGTAAAQQLLSAAEQYDFVIADRPAGFALDLEKALPDFTALILSGMEPMSLRGAASVCERLGQLGKGTRFLILNRFQPQWVRKRLVPDIDTLCDQVGAQLLGVIPEDLYVAEDVLSVDFYTDAPYRKALTRISRRLMGEPLPLPKLTKLLK